MKFKPGDRVRYTEDRGGKYENAEGEVLEYWVKIVRCKDRHWPDEASDSLIIKETSLELLKRKQEVLEI